MSAVTSFLESRWESLPFSGTIEPGDLSSVLVTPRFRASSHLLFFVLTDTRPDPLLVAKVPRLSGDTGQLDREAANLRAVEALADIETESVPHVLFYEDYGGHRFLIQTVVSGHPLKPAQLRGGSEKMIDAVLGWLIRFHRASVSPSRIHADWYASLVDRTLIDLSTVFPPGAPERLSVDATRRLLEPLEKCDVPLVFEHGDFCSPNILVGADDAIGVVDWELASPIGLPALDAIFFLNFAATCRARPGGENGVLEAFAKAFFAPNGWALPHLTTYRQELGLEPEPLAPLLALCWARYVANLARRLRKHAGPSTPLSDSSLAWLRNNRYYRLWNFALENSSRLAFR